ncbi:MAG: hypothetical protein OEM82_07060 [Acidobacteriota bacterium]|nr:hypothetical protein [Acidobacteriota bacterium]
MRFSTLQVVQLLIISLLLSTTVLPRGPRQGVQVLSNANASIETSAGIKTAIFDTDAGKIRFNLPEDMIAGDSLTGTVYALPAGKSENEQAKNLEKLNSHSIEAAGQVSAVSERFVRFQIPEDSSSESFGVSLVDKKGKKVSSVNLSLSMVSLSMDDGNYQIPEGGQTGRWINIFGPFDGDVTNTELRVGGKDANPLAESPRQSIFQSPADVIGPTELQFKEGNISVNRLFRNIDVN